MFSQARRCQNAFLFAFAVCLFAACAKPVAKFTSDMGVHSAPATIEFTNQSSKASAYYWDFGDGSTSTEANPAHRYSTSGNYVVTLQATAKNNSALDSNRIQIIGPKNCMVEISSTYGNIVVALSNKTPIHRDNFFKLVEEGFYTDLLFHRVIDGFVVQGGDPTDIGTGGPGYDLPAEFDPELTHVRGALAAARQPDEVNPDRRSNGSQFYIVSGRPVEESDLDAMQIRKGISYSSATRQQYINNGGQMVYIDRKGSSNLALAVIVKAYFVLCADDCILN